jgi:hypothetical protein
MTALKMKAVCSFKRPGAIPAVSHPIRTETSITLLQRREKLGIFMRFLKFCGNKQMLHFWKIK